MKRKRANIKEDAEAKSSQILFHKSKKLSEKLTSEHTDALEEDEKPAWIDEDDQNAEIKSTTGSKGTALYTDKLKQKYETLVGAPNWAKINKVKSEDDDNEILRTPKVLEIRTLAKLNTQTWNEGKKISCVEFHPKLSVALVAGDSGVVSLISVDKETNNKLHSFALKGWKISNAAFTPDGTHAFISSQSINRHYCVYDLVKAQPQMIDFPSVLKRPMIFEFSSNGKYIATSDGYDELFILSAVSKELIRRLKHNSKIVSVCFSHNCEQLFCYGAQGEVTMWDLSTFRSYRKFYDEGCVSASTINTSPCGRLLATGSGEGIINIYETSALKESSSTYNPVPYKTITNLTTKITCLKFNASTEIMAAVSNITPNAVKLVHIPSYSVFANFPTQGKSIGHLNTVGFSPNSGYMAIVALPRAFI
ncbi:hypothetical protein MSG28_002898 [Choristoneura fumiferana]|uniref:Uncharacterized protein n=1 Tax=Choristoneura fumiferana TaxID=7141 RepID=A0ACC0JJL8_CHOFU|nr:hypothetical protein MSG28_002898 [Choristoneura fumiferana]